MAATRENPARKPRQEARPATSAPHQGTFFAWLAQHQVVAVDSLLRLAADWVSTLLTCAVIGIALALPLTLVLLLQNVQRYSGSVEHSGSLSLYMDERAQPALLSLVKQLQNDPAIASATLITPEEALAEFERESGLAEALGGLDANPLPPVIEVVPAIEDKAALAELLASLQTRPGVAEVEFDQLWVERLDALLRFAERLALLLTLLLGSGVVLVIGNTVRLAIENRRAEIVVVKLVGGTDAYVARPFLYTGLWYGIGGAVIGCVLLQLGLLTLAGPLAQFIASYDGDFRFADLGFGGAFLVVAAAAGLGWLGAFVSVVQHLRSVEPR
ncbi:MAG: permease-like cell division protein FtsX [Pseudohongiellaceae bacterium]|jgi:cell division transport system permease protein